MKKTKLFLMLLISSITSMDYIMGGNVTNKGAERPEKTLWYAANDGDEATVRRLLEERPETNIDWLDSVFHGTPLYIAIMKGHDKVAQLLLEHGANVNHGMQDEFNTMPLIAAVQRGNINLIKKLLQYGADPNLSNIHGRAGDTTALRDAIGRSSTFEDAISQDKQPLIKLLLNAGADPDEPGLSGLGNSPLVDEPVLSESSHDPLLYEATLRGDEELVGQLLQHGADPDSPSRYGWGGHPAGETPLQAALRANNEDIVRALLRYGAHVGAWAKQLPTGEKVILEEAQDAVGPQKKGRAIRKGLSHFPKDITGLIEEFAGTSTAREEQ